MNAKKHTVTMRIISRNPNVWQAKCARHAEWTGPTYEYVEDEWRIHVHAETGRVIEPAGSKVGRWQPEVTS